jgi:hypothetical protein
MSGIPDSLIQVSVALRTSIRTYLFDEIDSKDKDQSSDNHDSWIGVSKVWQLEKRLTKIGNDTRADEHDDTRCGGQH